MNEAQILALLASKGLAFGTNEVIITNQLKCGESYLNAEGLAMGPGTKIHGEIDGSTTYELKSDDGILRCAEIDTSFYPPS